MRRMIGILAVFVFVALNACMTGNPRVDNATQTGGAMAVRTTLSFGERGVAVLNNYRDPIIVQIAGAGDPIHKLVPPLQQAAFPLSSIGGRTVYVTVFAVDRDGRPTRELAETSVSFQWGHCVGGGCADEGQRFLKFSGDGRFSYR